MQGGNGVIKIFIAPLKKLLIKSNCSAQFVCTLVLAIGVGVGIGVGFRLGEPTAQRGSIENRKPKLRGAFPNSFDTDPDSDTDTDKTSYHGEQLR